MSDNSTDIKLEIDQLSRGKCAVRLVRGKVVLLADRIDPHTPDRIKKFIRNATKEFAGLDHHAIRAELLQHAASSEPATPDADEDDAPYYATDDGLFWRKATREGQVSVPLTNFTARIQTDVVRDDGAEPQHMFEIVANLNGREYRFSIPASLFAAMNWPTEYMGPGAIVYAGMGIRDHARVAVQSLSTDHATRTIYTHLGWREVDGHWFYLHAGGAIGADGPTTAIEVDLPDALSNYVLPAPASGDELRTCVLASLDIMRVAPFMVTVPMLCAVYRAVLGVCDTTLWLTGPTGAKKSELDALGNQHFGAAIVRLKLPANWASTDNSLEGLAFAAKDALLSIDDFAPAGTQYDIQRLHQKADRVLRAQGNHAGRQRMRADGSLRSPRSPRGMIIATGEDTPRGVSLRARLFVTEVGPSDVNLERLTVCQSEARSGVYAKAMAAYVQWLAPESRRSKNICHPKSPNAARRLPPQRSMRGRRRPSRIFSRGYDSFSNSRSTSAQ